MAEVYVVSGASDSGHVNGDYTRTADSCYGKPVYRHSSNGERYLYLSDVSRGAGNGSIKVWFFANEENMLTCKNHGYMYCIVESFSPSQCAGHWKHYDGEDWGMDAGARIVAGTSSGGH
jgi:hypothetical protein